MRVLLAVDGSPRSRAVLEAVREHPWPGDTTFRVLSAVPTGLIVAPECDGIDYQLLLREAEQEAEDTVKQAARELAGVPANVETVVRRGDARHAIVDEATDWAADLIVLGSHGRTGLVRALQGNVAEYVVRHAPCSVEVARHRDGHGRAAGGRGH